MKADIKNLCLSVLTAGVGLLLLDRLAAQTFTTLHTFTNSPDGANPFAGLILAGNSLYGTTYKGGTNGTGTVFAVNTGGTGFTILHSFVATFFYHDSHSEGAFPEASLILSGNTLYGTTIGCGTNGAGTVFAVNTDGTGFTNLYNFTGGNDGREPEAGFVLSGGTLYGTTYYGGTNNRGTVFAINTNGTDLRKLHSFTYLQNLTNLGPNSDGAYPQAGLTLSGSTLYGTAWAGGTNGCGTVFAINTDGTGFTVLHHFKGFAGKDGATPLGRLILSGNTLYGTTFQGSDGIFALNTDGIGFTNLYYFTNSNNWSGPYAGLILSGNTLYGTTKYGGTNGYGTVFAIHTDGTGFTSLYNFTGTNDGANPDGDLILAGNTLYGTTEVGGSNGKGTIFSLSFPSPQLTISSSGTNMILTWPTDVAGFSCNNYALQSTTNLDSSAIWSAVSPPPVVVNGQNIVTNSPAVTQMFYRLSQ